ncbi:hypothetical protein EDD17DRAFT_1569614 [Pisolithus thermaeus]|nr:hypothetical protein EDD17DRAFT_1569614 [Pisolithus thermaeus]
MTSRLPPQTVECSPTEFQRPTLGYSVRLGELFNERTNSFLGIQLYEEKSAEVAVTNIQQTSLSLSSMNSLEEKASLLDIQASLSLAILGGLIKVGGSSSYLSDARSNSRLRSWTLALKVQTEEHRLLDGMQIAAGLPAAIDCISQQRATHFVSSIIYGSNLIMGMVEKHIEVTDEENTQGDLEFIIKQLEGVVSLSSSANAKAKARLKDLNLKFDLFVHGDVGLEVIPTDPTDVLDIIPRFAKSLLGDPRNGVPKGVPISVILRPIPKSVLDLAKVTISVYRMSRSLVNKTFRVFARLEDIRRRFHVLRGRANKYEDHIPKFSKHVCRLTVACDSVYDALMEKLGRFISGLMMEGKSDENIFSPYLSDPETMVHDEWLADAMFSGNWEEELAVDVRGQTTLESTRSLFQEQATSSRKIPASASHECRDQMRAQGHFRNLQPTGDNDVRLPFEADLIFLEKALQNFQHLVHDIRSIPARLAVNAKAASPFSTPRDIVRALRIYFATTSMETRDRVSSSM